MHFTFIHFTLRFNPKATTTGFLIAGRARAAGARVSNVIQFRRPVVSYAVIAKLVQLGYLHRGRRHKNNAVENAIALLRADLCRDGIISGGNAPTNDVRPQSEEERSL